MNQSNKKFYKKNVLIIGGARGIGFEIARQFANEGAAISIFDNNAPNLVKAKEQLSKIAGVVNIFEVDVSNQQQVINAVQNVEEKGAIDVLINNAGIATETPFLDITAEEWRRIIDINLTGMFFVAQAVCKNMALRKKGVVVNMASKNGLDGEFGYAHYNASKGGIIMLTKTMALELAHVGIRVNAVCPGYIQTPMSMEIDSPEFAEHFQIAIYQ
jgi:3-oxoacyl-[acyl-carrier protein] reductase